MIETKNCPNCDHPSISKSHYCFNCGQKVDLGILSVKRIVSEFFINLIDFDSKLFRSIRGLLTPGYLTNQYFFKKRVSYLSPMRMFVFLMFSFFAVLSLNGLEKSMITIEDDYDRFKQKNKSQIEDTRIYNLIERTNPKIKLLGLIESIEIEINNRIKFLQQKDKLENINSPEHEKNTPINIENHNQQSNNISTMSINELVQSKTILIDLKKLIDKNTSETYTLPIVFNRKIVLNITDINQLTTDQIVEKYQVTNWLDKIIIKQFIKINKNTNALGSFIFKNLTWVVVLEVVLMSLMFKLFYRRQKKLFVEHFIYHLHLRSFVFFVTMILLLLPFSINTWLNLISVLGMLIYFFSSLSNVYTQSLLTTVLKGSLFLIIELAVIFLSLIAVISLSSLLF